MAIVFSKDIPTNTLLNAYNNNVVEFSSDSGLDAVKCTITVGAYTFVITPINDVFYFNLKEIIAVLINDKNHKDDVNITTVITTDTNLLKSYTFNYEIAFTNDTTESIDKIYTFIKSVEQIGESTTKLLTENHLLNETELTIFKDYPVDVSLYTDESTINIEFDSYSNSFVSVPNVVSRVSLSDNIWGVDALKIGLTYVDISDVQILVNVKDRCNGTYLKWLNSKGGYSYWLFNPIYKDNISSTSLSEFNVDYDSLDYTDETLLLLGKSATKTRVFEEKNLTRAEAIQINSILTSPRVDMYNKLNDSWQSVLVKDGTFNILDTKKGLLNLKLSVEINQYTQY